MSRTERTYERQGVRYFETSAIVEHRVDHGGGGVTPNLTGGGSGAGWVVEWKNVISANAGPAEWVSYLYARSKRLSGTGIYEIEAHATLIEGQYYGGPQVFSVFTHSCAKKISINSTAQTCQSPQFDTSPGEKWRIVSGHYYDHGDNGSQDGTCPGCIDWVWTASSS